MERKEMFGLQWIRADKQIISHDVNTQLISNQSIRPLGTLEAEINEERNSEKKSVGIF